MHFLPNKMIIINIVLYFLKTALLAIMLAISPLLFCITTTVSQWNGVKPSSGIYSLSTFDYICDYI